MSFFLCHIQDLGTLVYVNARFNGTYTLTRKICLPSFRFIITAAPGIFFEQWFGSARYFYKIQPLGAYEMALECRWVQCQIERGLKNGSRTECP